MPRPSSSAASRQPRSCRTHAPSGQRSLRDAITRPTAPPVSGASRENGGTYDFASFIRPRMYGSTDTYALRTRTSPSAGSGSSTSASSKSDATGVPRGRAASRISRERVGTGGSYAVAGALLDIPGSSIAGRMTARRRGRRGRARAPRAVRHVRLQPLRNLSTPLLPCRAACGQRGHGVGPSDRPIHSRMPLVVVEGSLMRRIRILTLAAFAISHCSRRRAQRVRRRLRRRSVHGRERRQLHLSGRDRRGVVRAGHQAQGAVAGLHEHDRFLRLPAAGTLAVVRGEHSRDADRRRQLSLLHHGVLERHAPLRLAVVVRPEVHDQRQRRRSSA